MEGHGDLHKQTWVV